MADLGEGSGLSDALRAATEQKLALLKVVPGLTLLPAGHAIANSIEALTSPRMRQILDEAEATFDWVILDAPPMGATADARLLSQMVGGTLFVVRAGQTQCPDVQRAIESLGRENILGVVFNGVIDLQDGPTTGMALPTTTADALTEGMSRQLLKLKRRLRRCSVFRSRTSSTKLQSPCCPTAAGLANVQQFPAPLSRRHRNNANVPGAAPTLVDHDTVNRAWAERTWAWLGVYTTGADRRAVLSEMARALAYRPFWPATWRAMFKVFVLLR